MRYTIPAVLIAVMLGFAAWSTMQPHTPAKNPDPNHTHADFAVWVNGKQWDFTPAKYMTEESVAASITEEDETKPMTGTGADQLKKYLHLHDGNAHVIHRHKPGLTIGDFFTSIGFSLTDKCMKTDTGESYCPKDGKQWRMYVNGSEIPYDGTYIFKDDDHILLTYGSDDAEIAHELSLMTDDACLYSKTCPWRGPAPTENCIADPNVPCVVGQ